MARSGKAKSGPYRLERVVGEDTWNTVVHEGTTWDELTWGEIELVMAIFVDKYQGVPFRVIGPNGVAAWYDQSEKVVIVAPQTQ